MLPAHARVPNDYGRGLLYHLSRWWFNHPVEHHWNGLKWDILPQAWCENKSTFETSNLGVQTDVRCIPKNVRDLQISNLSASWCLIRAEHDTTPTFFIFCSPFTSQVAHFQSFSHFGAAFHCPCGKSWERHPATCLASRDPIWSQLPRGFGSEFTPIDVWLGLVGSVPRIADFWIQRHRLFFERQRQHHQISYLPEVRDPATVTWYLGKAGHDWPSKNCKTCDQIHLPLVCWVLPNFIQVWVISRISHHFEKTNKNTLSHQRCFICLLGEGGNQPTNPVLPGIGFPMLLEDKEWWGRRTQDPFLGHALKKLWVNEICCFNLKGKHCRNLFDGVLFYLKCFNFSSLEIN